MKQLTLPSSSARALLASMVLVCGLGVSCASSQGDEENLEVAVEETAVGNATAGQEAYADNQIALAGGEDDLGSNNLTVGVDPGGENQAVVGGNDNLEGVLPTEGNLAEVDATGDNVADIADNDEGNVLAEAGADPDLTADQSQDAIRSVIDENEAIAPLDNQLPEASNVAVGGDEITETAGDFPAVVAGTDGDLAGAGAASPAAVEGSSLPEMGAKLTYVVKKGDTLGDIAQSIYGDKSKWRDLARWSGFSNPHLIFPGNLVYYQYTEQSAAFAQQYENQPRAEVVVQAGDSLSGIAARVYGDFSHWVIIWRYNGHIANPDRIEVGQIVTYPQQGYLSAAHRGESDEVGNTKTEAAEHAREREVTQRSRPVLPRNTATDREAA